MKKIMNITGVLTVILTLLGSIFKTMHWPGAGAMIVFGGALFSLLFLPLLIAIKFRDDNSLKDKIVFSFGLLLGMGLSAGFLFKILDALSSIVTFSGAWQIEKLSGKLLLMLFRIIDSSPTKVTWILSGRVLWASKAPKIPAEGASSPPMISRAIFTFFYQSFVEITGLPR